VQARGVTGFAIRAAPRRIRRRPLAQRPHPRLAADPRLLSVAGAVGARVHDAAGRLVGLVDDVVVGSIGDRHPPVIGVAVHGRHGRTFVPVGAVAHVHPRLVLLTGPLEEHSVEQPPGLVALVHDLLDRQIVDVDGANVVRVSDLVLGRDGQALRLVGVDVSMRTLFRRLGPARLRRRVSPERVYDWTAVGAFSERGADGDPSVLHLTSAAGDLRRRGPAAVEELLADLPPHERLEFAAEMSRE